MEGIGFQSVMIRSVGQTSHHPRLIHKEAKKEEEQKERPEPHFLRVIVCLVEVDLFKRRLHNISNLLKDFFSNR